MTILSTRQGRKIKVNLTENEAKIKVFSKFGSYLYPFEDEDLVNDDEMFELPIFHKSEENRVAVLPQDIVEDIEEVEETKVNSQNSTEPKHSTKKKKKKRQPIY